MKYKNGSVHTFGISRCLDLNSKEREREFVLVAVKTLPTTTQQRESKHLNISNFGYNCQT